MSNAPEVVAPPGSGRVCAVCVTYHPDSDLPERLGQVMRQVSHLVVVDNGSSYAALCMLEAIARTANVTLIACQENLGIAKALNLGIAYAQSHGFEFALLLDQDTRVNEDLVAQLLRIYWLHLDRGRLAVVGAGYAADPDFVPVTASDLGATYVEVEAVIQSGSLLPLDAFKRIGPFRDEFFIDYVDNEYCARARKQGYLVVKSRRALMVHEIGSPARHRFLWMTKATRNHPADRLYYQARNDAVMLREFGHYRAGLWRLKALQRAIRTCKRVILFEQNKAAKVRGVVQGWLHGMRGRLGRRP